jgi:hypothetical protein
VPGLAHDELQRHLRLAEVGGGGVTQLVQVEFGVLVQLDAGAVVAEAGAAGVRADVARGGSAGRDGAAFGQERRAARAGAAVGQARRGSRWAVPLSQYTHSMAPPLERTGARRCSRSRSSTLSARISAARAAVSYSIRHCAFSRSGTGLVLVALGVRLITDTR